MTREEFKIVFDLNFKTVRNYIYYRCGDEDLATDVAQETFMKLWEKQLNFEGNNAKHLLFKISKDIFISHYRKQKNALNFKLSAKPQTQAQSPEEILQFEELQKSYNTALAAMPEKQRIVFLMHRLDGFKYAEIAKNLNLSVKAIEKRMKLALDFLRKNINN